MYGWSGEKQGGVRFFGGGVSVGQPVRGVAVIIAKKSFFCLENQKKNVYLHLKSMCDWRVCGDVLY